MLRILAIAPYEALKQRFEQAASHFENIQLESFVGDLGEGVKIVQEKQGEFDIVISRGGTAKEIKAISRIPVVEVDISILDVLRIIKMVETYSQRFVFIGYANITKQVKILSEIMEKQFDIVTIENQSDVSKVIEAIKQNAYTLVIGDKITTKIALEHELNAILIESGEESIEAAIENAISMGSTFLQRSEQQRYEQLIFQELGISFFLFNFELKRIVSYPENPSKSFLSMMKRLVIKLKNSEKQSIHTYEKIYGTNYSIELQRLDQTIAVFCKKVALVSDESGLITKAEREEQTDIHSNSSVLIGSEMKLFEKLLKKKSDLLIFGEIGTGKKSLKKIILNRELTKKHWTIHLDRMSSREEWQLLFDSYDSILYDDQTTFFVEGISDQTLEPLQQLLAFIQDMPNSSNQWLFFLTTSDHSVKAYTYLTNAFHIFSFEIKPLRERKEEIGSIISLYIYDFKTKYNKNVIGFEPGALVMMTDYSWPGNIQQLKQAIEEMVILTSGSFISKDTVHNYLAKYRKNWQTLETNSLINIEKLKGKSMEEIKQRIIHELLVLNKGNKTQTAKQLQISRSTLWRYLENDQ